MAGLSSFPDLLFAPEAPEAGVDLCEEGLMGSPLLPLPFAFFSSLAEAEAEVPFSLPFSLAPPSLPSSTTRSCTDGMGFVNDKTCNKSNVFSA